MNFYTMVNEKQKKELSVLIGTKIIEFLSQHGLLKHNQLYDSFHDMDTNEVTHEPTIETIAMIDGVSKQIYTVFSDYGEI